MKNFTKYSRIEPAHHMRENETENKKKKLAAKKNKNIQKEKRIWEGEKRKQFTYVTHNIIYVCV